MSYELALQRLIEFKRLRVEVELTEEGLFLVDEVPEDYAGSFTGRIELVYAVVQMDNVGRLRLSSFNPPDVMNKTRDTGLPIQIEGGHVVRAGSATPTIVVTWRDNTNFNPNLLVLANKAWSIMEGQLGEWVL